MFKRSRLVLNQRAMSVTQTDSLPIVADASSTGALTYTLTVVGILV